MYRSGHTNPGVAAVIALLERWFDGMRSGEVEWWFPASNYQRPGGKPFWAETGLERLVLAIDAEIDQEVDRAPGTQIGAKAGPDFKRLTASQRLALAQELEQCLLANADHLKEYQPS